jgi:hypothetical protein
MVSYILEKFANMSLLGFSYNAIIHPNRLIIKKERLYDSPRKIYNEDSKINLSRNIHHQRMSHSSIRKCKKAITYLSTLSYNKNYHNPKLWNNLKFKVAFITLTLPSHQQHSDNFIKKYCLNNFLIEARRKWNVERYVWRAERQQNGNIHFHILVDQFVPHQAIRLVWNSIIARYNYIDEYRKNMLEFHANGFNIRYDLIEKWSVTNQKKAYYQGLKENWSNPNTTDVHSLRLISNVEAYVTKYMTKETDKRHELVHRSKLGINKIPYNEKKKLSAETMKYLRMQAEIGRLWSCSFELTNIKGGQCICDSVYNAELNRIYSNYEGYRYTDEYIDMICISLQVLVSLKCIHLVSLFSEYVCSHFILQSDKDMLYHKYTNYFIKEN